MNRVTILFLLLAACGLASPARAAGTHFILEGGGGLGLTDLQATGPFWDITFGYGGKLKGFPPRFYIVSNYSGSALSGTGSRYLHEMRDHAFLAGPRVYLPIARNLRIYGQALFGGFWSSADWTIHDLEHYRARDDGVAGKFSVGFQARISPVLSVGALYDRMVFWEKDSDLSVPRFVGLDGAGESGDQNRFGATLTVHF
jgi:hypothetical protein